MIDKVYVIGVSGLAQSGKDTFTNAVIGASDYLFAREGHCERFAFADELKRFYASARSLWMFNNGAKHGIKVVRLVSENDYLTYSSFIESVALDQREEILNMLEEMFSSNIGLASMTYRVESEEDKKVHRPNLIKLGMFMRSLDEDFWVKAVQRKIRQRAVISSPALKIALISDVRFENETRVCDHNVVVVRHGIKPMMRDDGTVEPSEELAYCAGKFDVVIHNDSDVVKLRELAVAHLVWTLGKIRWGSVLQGIAV
jgi:hypothetical protein